MMSMIMMSEKNEDEDRSVSKNHPLHPKSPRRICTTPSRGRQRTWVPAWPLSSAPSPPPSAPRTTSSAPGHPLKLWVRRGAAAASRLQFPPTILTVNLPSQVRRWLREDVKTHDWLQASPWSITAMVSRTRSLWKPTLSSTSPHRLTISPIQQKTILLFLV